jgi:hypothetical protein
MTTIKATVKERRLELDAPAEWPDGTEVEIHPLNGATDEMSPAEIARTLAAMDQMQPFDMTDAEEAAWNTERQARIAREKAEFNRTLENLRKEWE